MKIYETNAEISLSPKYGIPPQQFHHGGTLWALVQSFKKYIQRGKEHNGENRYGGLYCSHWGYSEQEMKEIREIATQLGYL
jgi:hypothetical protein